MMIQTMDPQSVLGVLAVPLVVGLVIAIVAAFWVYKDAKSKDLHDPGGWGVLTFFGIIPFLILYILWGRNYTPSYRYPNCHCAECGRAK